MTAPKNVTSRTPSSWEPQDDVLLRHLKEVKRLGWKEIAQYFTNRTPNACQFRWRRLRSGNLKTVKPQEEEESHVTESRVQDVKYEVNDGKKGVGAVPMPIPTSNVTNNPFLSGGNGSTTNVSAGGLGSVGVNSVSGLNSGSFSKSPFSPTSHTPVSSVGVGKFVKPRSFSQSQENVSGNVLPGSKDQEENVGFIPKVVVRSRRGSSVVAPPVQSNLTVSLSGSSATSKSRKNSFSTRSRRSSFNVATDRHFITVSSTPSRRSSVVMAPGSLQSGGRRESFNSTSQSISRRNSVSQLRRGSIQTGGYIDLPKQNTSHLSQSFSSLNTVSKPWSTEEDKLLVEKRQQHHLTIDEISILLPHRSEQEIHWRIEALQNRLAGNVGFSSHNVHHASDNLDDTHSSSSSPDNAIDEDDLDTEIVGRMDDSAAMNHLREHSPTFSQTSSTGSSNRDRSPVFSPDTHSLRDNSPTVSDSNTSSLYGRLPSSLPKQIHQNHVSHHQPPPPPSSSSQPPHISVSENHHAHSTQNQTEANHLPQKLPSLNTIFNHMI